MATGFFRKIASSWRRSVEGAQSGASATRPGPGGIDLKTDEFHLKLPPDWQAEGMDDDEQWGFQSDAKQSVIVISVLQAAFPADKILKTANVLADQRLNAETKLRAHRNVQFGDKFVELKDDGALGYVAYAGYDDYTIFRFAGWVTGRKVLSLFVETRTRDNALSKAVFKEVLDGFGFYRP